MGAGLAMKKLDLRFASDRFERVPDIEMSSTKRLTIIALLVSIALVASIIENAFPSIPLVPGAKIGLSNIAPLIALLVLGVCDAYTVMLIKSFLSALLGGGLTMLMYSVPSGIVSLTVEVILVYTLLGNMSIACISMLGAIVFNGVQVLMASLITGVSLVTLFPILAVIGALGGGLTGAVAYYVVKKMPYSVYGRRINN